MHRIDTESGPTSVPSTNDCTYNNLFKNSNTTGGNVAAKRIADEARSDLAQTAAMKAQVAFYQTPSSRQNNRRMVV